MKDNCKGGPSMKVLVLGGGGHMGGYGVKILSISGVQSVVLADLNQEQAEELAKPFPEVSTVPARCYGYQTAN